jgi:DNA-binding IclR family transcriptional regulator
VEQASRILVCLGKSRKKMTLTEICKEVGIHKSKGHSILNTLKDFGFVEKNPVGKTYALGIGLLFLSRSVLDRLSYPEIVNPLLRTLAEETNATALFGLIQGDHVLVVSKHEGNQNIGFTLKVGHSFHLTLGAHGKAIVAFMPEKEREKILARKRLFFYGDPSSLEMGRLRKDLEACRSLGYAEERGEITPGVSALSAPIFGLDEKILGCVILMGTFPEAMIERYGAKVSGVARQISYKLGADVERLDGVRSESSRA